VTQRNEATCKWRPAPAGHRRNEARRLGLQVSPLLEVPRQRHRDGPMTGDTVAVGKSPRRTEGSFSKFLKKMLVDLPSPLKISYAWNFGFFARFCLIIQLVTGIFLSFHYVGEAGFAFYSVKEIFREIKGGWVFRSIHVLGVSLFFVFVYAHLSRNIYYSTFNLVKTWKVGVLMLVCLMAIAFFGYVLP
jgi:quinol-cytochrome oxidoreductase complex cytochrome b subunit